MSTTLSISLLWVPWEWLAVWLSGNALASINVVALHQTCKLNTNKLKNVTNKIWVKTAINVWLKKINLAINAIKEINRLTGVLRMRQINSQNFCNKLYLICFDRVSVLQAVTVSALLWTSLADTLWKSSLNQISQSNHFNSGSSAQRRMERKAQTTYASSKFDVVDIVVLNWSIAVHLKAGMSQQVNINVVSVCSFHVCVLLLQNFSRQIREMAKKLETSWDITVILHHCIVNCCSTIMCM